VTAWLSFGRSASTERATPRTAGTTLRGSERALYALPSESASPPSATASAPLRQTDAGPRAKVTRVTPEALELSIRYCSWGAPGDCMRVAHAYRDRDPSDAKRARLYYQLAISIYTRECRARDPVACQALSRLYATADGIKLDRVQARALRARALELCRIHPQPECAKLERMPEVR
jgi:hypothetical protein